MSETLEAIKRATTVEDMAAALRVWAIEAAETTGHKTPQWWAQELRRYVEGRADESHGMTLEELIPEAIDEWKRIRAITDTGPEETER